VHVFIILVKLTRRHTQRYFWHHSFFVGFLLSAGILERTHCIVMSVGETTVVCVGKATIMSVGGTFPPQNAITNDVTISKHMQLYCCSVRVGVGVD
jgi:hypothetical protein